MAEVDFAKSWDAYKRTLEEKLGREPTADEIREEMSKFGWDFTDV